MTDKKNSYRQILKSSSIIGGSSFINIGIGVIRTKVLAVLLGPAGLGLVSLYTGLMTTSTAIATMGVGSVGTRQIAEAAGKKDARALIVARRALFWGTLMLACAGGFVVWTLRDILALKVLGNKDQGSLVGWLALGVALSVAGVSQGALIQGMRRIGDLARLSVFGAVINTILGVALLWQWGNAGLIAYVLIGPLSSFVLGHVFVSRLPKLEQTGVSVDEMKHHWKTLLRLGFAFMGAGLAGTLVQLWIRVEVQTQLGPSALGHFQAAWSISMQYISFILSAMSADYYPRLTSIIYDKEAATRLVNEQTEIALLMSGPIFIAMIGLAPWVIQLLYSPAFLPTVDVLRWQILGDILKVASWPMGFVILAAGDGKTFFFTETSCLLLMGGMVKWFLPVFGLQITGIAFLACYVYLGPLVYLLARRRINFRWTGAVKRLLFVILLPCLTLVVFKNYSVVSGVGAIIVSAIFSLYSIGRLGQMSDLTGKLGKISAISRTLSRKIGLKYE